MTGKELFYVIPQTGHGVGAVSDASGCDMDCYVHLVEKGVLPKKFKTLFRKREPWEFVLKEFL